MKGSFDGQRDCSPQVENFHSKWKPEIEDDENKLLCAFLFYFGRMVEAALPTPVNLNTTSSTLGILCLHLDRKPLALCHRHCHHLSHFWFKTLEIWKAKTSEFGARVYSRVLQFLPISGNGLVKEKGLVGAPQTCKDIWGLERCLSEWDASRITRVQVS